MRGSALFAALAACSVLVAGRGHAATITVTNEVELEGAFGNAGPGDVIQIMPGTYSFNTSIWTANNGSPGSPIVVRANTLGPVKLDFDSIEALVFNNSDWVLENIWLNCNPPGNCEAGVQVKPSGHRFQLRGCRITNWVQHVKGSRTPSEEVEDVVIEDSEFYNDTLIDGSPIDVVGGKRWRISGNYVHDFGGDEFAGDYGIFLKGDTSDGIIERNLVICARDRANFGIEVGISFGSGGTGGQFCPGGNCACEDTNSVARNNIVLHCSDVGLHTRRACGSRFFNNLVYDTAAGLQIQENGPGAPLLVQNNVMGGNIIGQSNFTQINNRFDQSATIFNTVYQDVDGADLRDGPNVAAFQNQGNQLAEVISDYCGRPRDDGANDLGPIEFSAACSTWPWPSIPQQGGNDAGVRDFGGPTDAGFTDQGLPVDAGASQDTGVGLDFGFDDSGVPLDGGFAPPPDAETGDDRSLTRRDLGDDDDDDPGQRTGTEGGCGCQTGAQSLGAKAKGADPAGLLLLLALVLPKIWNRSRCLTLQTRTALGLLIVLNLAGRHALAADVNADPATYLAAAAGLSPGDRLILAPGTYTGCLVLEGLHASEMAPTIITGPASGPAAIFLATNCSNGNRLRSATIQIRDVSYLVIQQLELSGTAGTTDIDAIEADYSPSPSHHVTIQDVYIHDHDFDSGVNAISTKAPVWDFVIRRNRLINNGLGLYLGDSDGTAPFIRGTIEHNLVLNPKGYGMQIKHQLPRPLVAGLPPDGGVTLIRHNTFIKAARAVTGGNERPNLLVGHFPLSGAGLNDRYEIYGNFLYQNQTDIEPLFQGEGNIAFHDNVCVNTYSGIGIWVRPQNDVPKEVAIYRNTVLVQTTGIEVSGGDPGSRQQVLGNAVFSEMGTPIVASDVSSNITGDFAAAQLAFASIDTTLGILDLYPQAGQLTGAAVDYSPFSAHRDFDRDFNSRPIDATFRGAYSGFGANPGWMLAEAIKPPATMDPPPMDAGTADGAAPDGNAGDLGVDSGVSGDANTTDDGGPLADSAGSSDGAADGGQRDASPAGDGGPSSADAGTNNGDPESDGGCGCRATGPGSRSFDPVWLGAALLLGAIRKKTRSRLNPRVS